MNDKRQPYDEIASTVSSHDIGDKEDVEGLITNLLDFAVHDGPGLRVLVFLKGCQLKCRWCQNPENIASYPEVEYHSALCLECLHCVDACPISGAIVLDKEQRIDRGKCIRCMRCVDVCLGGALTTAGIWVSAKQIVKKVARYKPFFARSDRGGVTLSGGDPLYQPEFSFKLLSSFRELGIHTAIETCGFSPYEILKNIGEAADLVLYDIKHMDEAAHIEGTGRPNRLILDNLKRFCQEVDTEIAVRIPLICGFNEDDKNIRRTAEFISSLKKIKRLDLLPFNELASVKYRAMGLEWEYNETRQQSTEQLARLKEIVEGYGLEPTIGGLW